MNLKIYAVGTLLFSVFSAIAAEPPLPSYTVLPAGVPALTSDDAKCFTATDNAQWKAWVDYKRIKVASCTTAGITAFKYGVIPPVVNHISGRSYATGSKDTYDCYFVRKNKFFYKDALSAEFSGEYVDAADKYGKTGTVAQKNCLVDALYTHANGNSMTVLPPDSENWEVRDNSLYRQMWKVGAMSASYFGTPALRKVADEQAHPADPKKSKHDIILGWMHKVANGSAPKIEVIFNANVASNAIDNKTMWLGYDILPIGYLYAEVDRAKARNIILLSRRIFAASLKQITVSADPIAEGYLPHELKRGKKALSYHGFASYAVLGSAIMSQAYDCNFPGNSTNRRLLGKLIQKYIEANYDHQAVTFFEKEARRVSGIANLEIGQGGSGSAELLKILSLYPGVGTTLKNDVLNYLSNTWRTKFNRTFPAIDISAAPAKYQLGGAFQKIVDESVVLKSRDGTNLCY